MGYNWDITSNMSYVVCKKYGILRNCCSAWENDDQLLDFGVTHVQINLNHILQYRFERQKWRCTRFEDCLEDSSWFFLFDIPIYDGFNS